jgi:prolipoprotein diacylglyceryl transferase
MADSIAPGLVLAQAIGRWGNWFNQELYGRPTHLPWAVRIDSAHQVGIIPVADQHSPYGTFQPTFLYESLWDLGTAGVLLWADRRFKLGHGRVFALYLVVYGIGRGWIEALRIDPAHHFFGLRLNDWTSIVIVIAGAIAFVVSSRRHPGRELVVEPSAGAAATGTGDDAVGPVDPTAEPTAEATADDAAATPQSGAEESRHGGDGWVP